jgi:hypothetical protein
MLSTGIVRDFLQASWRVLIHTPNIITTIAKTCTMTILLTCSTYTSNWGHAWCQTLTRRQHIKTITIVSPNNYRCFCVSVSVKHNINNARAHTHTPQKKSLILHGSFVQHKQILNKTKKVAWNRKGFAEWSKVSY